MQEISSVNIYFIWLLGKGESIWDRFVHRHGNIPKEANGDVASDSYHKYPEDIKCIERLGVNMLVSVMIISKPKVYLVLLNFLLIWRDHNTLIKSLIIWVNE